MKNNNLQINTITKNDLVKMAESNRNGRFTLSFYLGLKPGVNSKSEVNSIFSGETERIKKEKEYSATSKKKMLRLVDMLKKETNFLRLPQEANTLAFFLREGEGLMIYRVPVHIESKIVIGSDFYIEPLVKAIEKFSRYLVVLVERDKAEFYIIFLGEFEREPEVIISDVPKKIRTSVSDDWHGRREKRIERHIEDHLRSHFKSVALKIREYFDKNGLNYLIIGGHGETKAKFYNFLDKKYTKNLIGFFSIAHHDSNSIKEKSKAIIAEYEKALEEKITEKILDSIGGKKWTAVAGMDSVLDNFYLHKIEMLVVGVNYKNQGFVCRHCHQLSLAAGTCSMCGGKVTKVNNLVDEIKEEAIKNKIEIKQLFYGHKNFDRFGIGAFLKEY